MDYPSADDFEQLLLTEPLDDLVGNHVLGGVPWVFRDDADGLEALTGHLDDALDLAPEAVHVVGSARLGFSLNPKNFKRPFTDGSDLDVAVIDERLFDSVWLTLLEWNYPRRKRLPQPEWRWLRQRQDDLYWGWFRPELIGRHTGLLFPEILEPVRDFAANWFSAFQSIGRLREFASRKVSGRLYRTMDHARLYHRDGLRQLQLIAQKEEDA